MKKIQHPLLYFLLFGTMLLFGLIENFKGVSYPLIKTGFSATDVQQGFMVSMLSMSYVGFCVIAGLFLGRFGIKPSFIFGFSAICAGLVLVFFMPGFFSTAASLFVIFAGFGFFEVGLNALASRVFVKRTALLMNLLHGFYGIGAMIGPKAAGAVVEYTSLGWRYVYLLSLPPVIMLFIPGIFTRFPENAAESGHGGGDTAGRKSFFDALRSPAVWLMSVTLGLEVIIEMNSSNWGPLYFQEVYGLSPSTGGAAFLSAFFLVFTVSRLVCGPLVEKIGYTRSLVGAAVIVLVIFAAGFCLGKNGVYVLPALGFFIALLWPTIMAAAVVLFGKDAPVYSSAMIAIAGLINALVQFLVGLTNRVNPAWGYRSSMVYTVFLIAALIPLHRTFMRHNRPSYGT